MPLEHRRTLLWQNEGVKVRASILLSVLPPVRREDHLRLHPLKHWRGVAAVDFSLLKDCDAWCWLKALAWTHVLEKVEESFARKSRTMVSQWHCQWRLTTVRGPADSLGIFGAGLVTKLVARKAENAYTLAIFVCEFIHRREGCDRLVSYCSHIEHEHGLALVG